MSTPQESVNQERSNFVYAGLTEKTNIFYLHIPCSFFLGQTWKLFFQQQLFRILPQAASLLNWLICSIGAKNGENWIERTISHPKQNCRIRKLRQLHPRTSSTSKAKKFVQRPVPKAMSSHGHKNLSRFLQLSTLLCAKLTLKRYNTVLAYTLERIRAPVGLTVSKLHIMLGFHSWLMCPTGEEAIVRFRCESQLWS